MDGVVVDVSDRMLGSELAEDVSLVSELPLVDDSDFDRNGGLLRIGASEWFEDGTVAPYTVEVDEDSVESVVVDGSVTSTEGTRIDLYPPVIERIAQVRVNGQDDTFPAIVDHALYDKLPTGVREPGDEVAVRCGNDSDGVLRVLDILGETPSIDPIFQTAPPGALVVVPTKTVSNDTAATLDIGLEVFNDGSVGVETSGLVITQPGVYTIVAVGHWAIDGNGRRELAIRLARNGENDYLAIDQLTAPPSGSFAVQQAVTPPVELQPQDVISVRAWQNSGGALSFGGGVSGPGSAPSLVPVLQRLGVYRIGAA